MDVRDQQSSADVPESPQRAPRPWFRRGSPWVRFAIIMLGWLGLELTGILWCGLRGDLGELIVIGFLLSLSVPQLWGGGEPKVELTRSARQTLILWYVVASIMMIGGGIFLPKALAMGTTISAIVLAMTRWTFVVAVVASHLVVMKRVRRSLQDAGYLLCPTCEYQLRGLPDEGICPECGEEYSAEYSRRYWQGQVKPEHPEDRFRR